MHGFSWYFTFLSITLLHWNCFGANTTRDHFRDGVFLFNQGQYISSSECFDKAVKGYTLAQRRIELFHPSDTFVSCS